MVDVEIENLWAVEDSRYGEPTVSAVPQILKILRVVERGTVYTWLEGRRSLTSVKNMYAASKGIVAPKKIT